MKRTAMLLAVVVGVVVIATGVAVAASSPTVTTGAARGVGPHGAHLNGFVNPGGNQTTFVFQYGPTTGLGLQTPGKSAGHGSKTVAVSEAITGLNPGTRYYYRLVALNKSGVATGATRSLKTSGAPPAAIIPGPVINIGKFEATPTADINPEGASTTYYVDFGLTPMYGFQSASAGPIVATDTPVPVAVPLTVLAPGKLYHYRFVAVHAGSTSTSTDATFFTYPSFRRKPKMHTSSKPGHLTRKPYTFTTSGSLYDAALFVPQTLRCTGQVGIRYYEGRKQEAYVLATIDPDCKFSSPVPFKRLINGGSTGLTVKIHYRGNGYLKPADATDHVTLG